MLLNDINGLAEFPVRWKLPAAYKHAFDLGTPC